MMKIADYFKKGYGLDIIRSWDDEAGNITTIADLAQFVEFDPEAAKWMDASPAFVAGEALYDEYGKYGEVRGYSSTRDGTEIEFVDGSSLFLS